MTITERFLKAKHWQLFIITTGIPMIVYFVIFGSMFVSISKGETPDMKMLLSSISIFSVLMLVSSGVLWGWYWSVAIGLQSKVPENIKMKVSKFKVFFFTPLVYFVLITIFTMLNINTLFGGAENSGEPNIGLIAVFFPIIFILNLFCIFCMLYCLYFIAKTFKTVELQRKTTFSNFVGEFLMIWFYPIGVWFLQPKINKMVETGIFND